MNEQTVGLMKSLLLEELKTGTLSWYMIQSGGKSTGFTHTGAFIQARGPTEAWQLFHFLNLWQGGPTTTYGPFDDDLFNRKVPPEMRWRKLTLAEIESFGEKKENQPVVVKIAADGRCTCNCAQKCPLGRMGIQYCCTERELNDAGIKTER